MKIHTILSSFNRPKGIQRAIKSVLEQQHTDWNLYVMDDKSDFPVEEYCQDERIQLFIEHPTEEQRLNEIRYAKLINIALDLISKADGNEVIVYLCDDDWFFPNWFSDLSKTLAENEKMIIFGKEILLPFESVGNQELLGGLCFPSLKEAKEPKGRIDHCQVAHRVSCIQSGIRWPLIFPADQYFFEELAKHWGFEPLEANAVQKAIHSKGLHAGNGQGWESRFETKLKGWRE